MHRQNNYKDSSSEKEQDSKFPLSPIPSRDISTYVYWISEYLWVSGLEIVFFFLTFFSPGVGFHCLFNCSIIFCINYLWKYSSSQVWELLGDIKCLILDLVTWSQVLNSVYLCYLITGKVIFPFMLSSWSKWTYTPGFIPCLKWGAVRVLGYNSGSIKSKYSNILKPLAISLTWEGRCD